MYCPTHTSVFTHTFKIYMILAVILMSFTYVWLALQESITDFTVYKSFSLICESLYLQWCQIANNIRPNKG